MVPELYGFLIGIIAGLVPGIHPNTFASLMLSASFLFTSNFESYEIAIIIFTSSITYSVVNIIPAVFIGVPDEDTAVAVFPAHRMVLNGDGMKAISISAFSSFVSAILSLPIFYLLIYSERFVRGIESFTQIVLILISLYLILLEDDPFGGSLAKWRKRSYAFIVFVFSGILGIFSMKYFNYSKISILFPLLTGLFSFPTLIIGTTSEKIPQQKSEIDFPRLRNVMKGVSSGLLVSLFPGISSGVATALSVGKSDDEKDYITSISSANTANTILNFAMLISVGKIRSGVAQAFSSFATPEKFQLLPFISLSSAFAGMAFTFLFSYPALRIFQKIDPSKISKTVLIFLIISIYLTNGFTGIGIFAIAGIIGISTLYLNVRRIHCMGSIILPAIIY